jgi:FkbM family methyltransferase
MAEDATRPDQEPILTNGPLRLRRCRRGVMLYNLNDVYLGTMLDRYGEFSEGECEAFAQLLHPGMTVVEVGANIGAHTVPIAQAVGRRGRVLALEPQRGIFQILCANLALNGLDHVEPHWAAAGSAEGFVTVPRLDSRARQNFGGLPIGEAQQGDKVRLVTIDGFDLPACHLLKIDVEGMEAEVIRGARETIARHKPVIYAENDRRDKAPALIALLQELDYRCYWHKPLYVRVPNFRGSTENAFPGLVSINMLCIPRSRDITVKGGREVLTPQDDWSTAPAETTGT